MLTRELYLYDGILQHLKMTVVCIWILLSLISTMNPDEQKQEDTLRAKRTSRCSGCRYPSTEHSFGPVGPYCQGPPENVSIVNPEVKVLLNTNPKLRLPLMLLVQTLALTRIVLMTIMILMLMKKLRNYRNSFKNYRFVKIMLVNVLWLLTFDASYKKRKRSFLLLKKVFIW